MTRFNFGRIAGLGGLLRPGRRGSPAGHPPLIDANPDRPVGTPALPVALPACFDAACRTLEDDGLAAYILPADGVCLGSELMRASEDQGHTDLYIVSTSAVEAADNGGLRTARLAGAPPAVLLVPVRPDGHSDEPILPGDTLHTPPLIALLRLADYAAMHARCLPFPQRLWPGVVGGDIGYLRFAGDGFRPPTAREALAITRDMVPDAFEIGI